MATPLSDLNSALRGNPIQADLQELHAVKEPDGDILTDGGGNVHYLHSVLPFTPDPTMTRQLAEHRCPRCEIRRPLCFCDAIPSIVVPTRLVIVMHPAEEVLTTNTARLAAKALPNCEIRLRGRRERMSTDGLVEAGRPAWLLYPSPRARELTADLAAGLNGPATLIIPDGSWSQTRRMVRREPALAAIPQVKLPPGPPSAYRLRAQPSDMSLCTLEAIARALGILEGPQVQEQLETLLRVMVERTLWSRGMLASENCTTGAIPRAAFG